MGAKDRALIGPVFRNQDCLGLSVPQAVGEILQEIPGAMAVYHCDFIEAKAIDVVLIKEKTGIIDEELPHFLFPIGEDQSTGPALIGEVETAVVVAFRLPVIEVNSLGAKIAAGVIVDDVKNNRDP